jgi:molybdopterin molybdotransferase
MPAKLLTVRDAHARVIAAFSPLPAETVSVADAAGRVLARAPKAQLTQPPADLSAMDGYAVRAEDVPAAPTTLKLVGQAPAGGSYDKALKPGETVRIFTGGPLPMGADAIVIQEDTKADGDKITILEAPRTGRHIRKAGLDFSAGDTLFKPGHTLTTRDVALAAAMNLPWLSVHRKPRVAILSTGNELVMPGEPVGRNQIVSSSGIAMAALIRAWGAEPTLFDIARDEAKLIGEHIAAGAQHDLLITLGGASVGDHDLVQDALKAQGFAMDFWRIAMRPGKPLMFAAKDRARVLGLPGNPVSSYVCAVLFLVPLLRKLTGRADIEPTLSQGVLGRALKANDERQDYLRATLARRPDGTLVATPFPEQDSSMLVPLAAADCLVIRPPHAPAAATGTPCVFVPLDA